MKTAHAREKVHQRGGGPPGAAGPGGCSLPQERFTEFIGISPQNVSCEERGLAGMSLTVLRRMCQILWASSDFLLIGEGADNDAEAIAHRLG